MVEAKCTNCGDVFEPEHSEDDICKVCYETELSLDIESSRSQDLTGEAECLECGVYLHEEYANISLVCADCGGY